MPDNLLSCPKCNNRMHITKGIIKCDICGYSNTATQKQVEYSIFNGQRKREVIEIDTTIGREE